MLDVFLSELRVGVIGREEGTSILAFALDDAYADMPRRPVLGQQFEERRQHRVFRQASYPGQLPTFFANLLPEGALGAMIAAQTHPDDAADILAVVGEDLPGAVIVRPAVATAELPSGVKRYDEPLMPDSSVDDSLRFSLAGVQLKFSAVESAEDRFTLPFRGLEGRWILKFGSEVYPGLPENEFAVMGWAHACGLNVPEHRLVSARSVAGLDARFLTLGENVFAIRRFDRLPDGGRVHQEDFAQVRGLPPDRKYSGASLEGLARFVGDQCGQDDLVEYLRRVFFLLLCGNTDAHLKNWSLVYPDGRSARLSPAYDFVCVRQYLPQNELALPLAKEKSPERIGWNHVARVEKFLRMHGHNVELVKFGKEFVRRGLDEWASRRSLFDAPARDAVERHLAELPIVKDL
ncbi:MAG: type II toxin-antitoxin system HipA family toxin [Myxococcaceae bacterium]|nr:type II toxin-antitoxin system HipA family toxin [Myxococcaceae bacterium]